MSGYNRPLQVVAFIATRRDDAERGPLVRIRPEDAALRMLNEGDMAWVYGPRRHELAHVVIDETVPKDGVVVRDIAGVAPSEMVRIVNTGFDRSQLPKP